MSKTPLIVHCSKCTHEWAIGFLPMRVDLFAKVGKSHCPMCGSKKIEMGQVPMPTIEGDALAWLDNGDTGISSKTIWKVMMGIRGASILHTGTPSDPSDFGRCYRLLKVMPSWRARLSEVSEHYPEWERLVGAWDELTVLYEKELPTGQAPTLYKRMKELLQGATP